MNRCAQKYSPRVCLAIIAALAVLSWLAVYEFGSFVWHLLGWAWL